MIRKTLIVLLTILAGGIVGLQIASFGPAGWKINREVLHTGSQMYWALCEGCVCVGWTTVESNRPADPWWSLGPFEYSVSAEMRFWFGNGPWPPRRFGHCLKFPLWFPFLLFAAYPALAFIRGPWRRHRRQRKGLCLKCGYDLTGNTSGRCPECGEAVTRGG